MATLTPSELAALLGPCTVPLIESTPVVTESSSSRWISFAEEIARDLTTRLRPLIRAAVRVTFSGSHTLTAEAVTASQENRDVVRLWQSARSIEPMALVLSSPLVATFVDRLLGGHSAPHGDETDLHRPLTDVDQRCASRLSDAVRQSVSERTEKSSPLELTEWPGHSNSLVEAWLPDCLMLRLSFDLRFVQGGGSLGLLLPMEFAEAFADQRDVVKSPPNLLSQMPVESSNLAPRRTAVVAQLGHTPLLRSDLQSLAIGDILLMPAISDQCVRVLIDGHAEFDGIAGAIDGHKAIRLTNAASVRTS